MPVRKTKSAVKAATKKTTARERRAAPSRAKTSSVIMQARVQGLFAEELLAHDAAILGLEGPSEVVREGLRLVHRRAQEQALIDAYDDFYGGRRAPLPVGVVSEESD